jgi:hypothetical protein
MEEIREGEIMQRLRQGEKFDVLVIGGRIKHLGFNHALTAKLNMMLDRRELILHPSRENTPYRFIQLNLQNKYVLNSLR